MGPSSEWLVDTHLDALYGLARAWTYDEDLAKELTHRTFLKAFEKRGQLRDIKAARAWLITIFKNELTTEFRKRSREVDLQDEHADLPDASESDAPFTEDALLLLPSALERLPGALKEILLLRFQQELSYEEISQLLGVPTGTVMSRLHRAKAALRTHLDAHLSTGGTR